MRGHLSRETRLGISLKRLKTSVLMRKQNPDKNFFEVMLPATREAGRRTAEGTLRIVS